MNCYHDNQTLCKIYTAKILNDFSNDRDITKTVFEFYSKFLPNDALNEATLGQSIIANINSTIEEIKNRYRRLVGKDPKTTNVANNYTMFTKHVQEKLNAAIPNIFKQAQRITSSEDETKKATTTSAKQIITNSPPEQNDEKINAGDTVELDLDDDFSFSDILVVDPDYFDDIGDGEIYSASDSEFEISEDSTIYQKRSFHNFYESKNIENLISQTAIQIVQDSENSESILNEFVEQVSKTKIVFHENKAGGFPFGRSALFGPENTQRNELTNFGTKVVDNLKNLIKNQIEKIPQDKKNMYTRLLDNVVKLVIKQLNIDFKSTIKEFESRSVKKPDNENYEKVLAANLSKNTTMILKTLGYNADKVLEQIKKAFDKGNKKLLDNYKNELMKKLNADPSLRHNKNIIVQFFDNLKNKQSSRVDADLEEMPEKKQSFFNWLIGKKN